MRNRSLDANLVYEILRWDINAPIDLDIIVPHLRYHIELARSSDPLYATISAAAEHENPNEEFERIRGIIKEEFGIDVMADAIMYERGPALDSQTEGPIILRPSMYNKYIEAGPKMFELLLDVIPIDLDYHINEIHINLKHIYLAMLSFGMRQYMQLDPNFEALINVLNKRYPNNVYIETYENSKSVVYISSISGGFQTLYLQNVNDYEEIERAADGPNYYKQKLIKLASGAPLPDGEDVIEWSNKLVITNERSFDNYVNYFGPRMVLNEYTRIEWLHYSDELFMTLFPHITFECAIKNVITPSIIQHIVAHFGPNYSFPYNFCLTKLPKSNANCEKFYNGYYDLWISKSL